MSILQSEMTRYYDHMRPRYSNPTYASTSVGSTLSMHLPLIYRNLQNHYSYSELRPLAKELSIQTDRHRRSTSQLSNIASNSLRVPSYLVSDKQVYDKQQKDYNIISSKPKFYEDSIKMYPKYRLENEDRNYFRKLELEKELTEKLNTKRHTLIEASNPQKERKQVIRGKYLNNLDEVADIM